MAPAPLPALLGPYRVLGLLGRGGMGVVYRAVDDRLHREVAIKALPFELTRDGELRERFAAEARAQARLQHPHIVAVHDVLEVAGVAYLVMELFGSRSLEELLRERGGRGLPEDQALRILGQVLSALDYAHSQGIIHRDVKPGNVLVSATGVAKLTDFGIALRVGEERRTKTSQTVGTPVYMSPEQIKSPQSLDHRSDIYSAGVLLFELLAGRPPFDGKSDYEIQRLHLERPAEQVLSTLAASSVVCAALSKALRKEPRERFSSAAAFERALHAVEPAALPREHARSAGNRVGDRGQPNVRPRRARTVWGAVILALTTLTLLGKLLDGWQQRDPPSPTISNQYVIVEPPPAPIQAPAAPHPEPPPPPVRRDREPPRPDPTQAIREQALVRLRAELAAGTAQAERWCDEGRLEEARQKVQELLNRSYQHRTDLVDEMATLSLLSNRITEQEIERRTAAQHAQSVAQAAAQAERQAWERRLTEIDALLSAASYPEAKQLAQRLAAEAGAPADVAARARELVATAEEGMKQLWQGAGSKTDATLLNPRRKKQTEIDRDDDDDR